MLGITEDGVAGKATKLAIVNTKRCVNVDPFHNVRDEHVKDIKFEKGSTVRYSIGDSPGFVCFVFTFLCFILFDKK